MTEAKLPYMIAHSVISRTLEKVITAATPDRFTQDFLVTKLGVKGGSAKPVIPFMKRTGFLGTDGAPTDLYKRFRNPAESGYAAAQALRIGFAPLYEMNEYAHDLSDKELTGIIVQSTGLEADSRITKAILWSFKALKEYALFDGEQGEAEPVKAVETVPVVAPRKTEHGLPSGVNISYTINLNLPATSDIAVFDAIFKSLKENLLSG